MEKYQRALSALMAVFPTMESYTRFIETPDHQGTIQSFAAYAHSCGVIEMADETLLEKVIAQNACANEMCTPPIHLNFAAFFDQKDTLLELNLSVRALTNRINSLLAEYEIELPNVSNSMLTRLKKEPADTPHKLNVLRSLAFWLGHDRPQLGPNWNFETLVKLCSQGKPHEDYKEGVRVGFALFSRGDVIDHETVTWLKKEVKNYTETSIGRFSYGRWGKVRAHDITTIYVDFPKENQVGNPASYRECLRSTMSLAHQIAIRWPLSKHYSQNRFLSIGLAAGTFANLDNHLLPILNAKIPGDPVVRLTDYARQCTLINDMRVILSKKPAEITLFNDESLTIWWVVAFWNSLYFDFVPDLLKDPLLQTDTRSHLKLTRELWSGAFGTFRKPVDAPPSAITTFFRYPQNSLLGVEIAKTLYYRGRFWEGIEILRIVLSLDATNIVARTLHMVHLRNLAANAPSLTIAKDIFNLIYQQAAFAEKYQWAPSEDFYCESAIAYLTEAMIILKFMRNPVDQDKPTPKADSLRQRVFKCLNLSESKFSTGLMLSPNGSRANYFINMVKIIRAILTNDESIFFDPASCIDTQAEILRNVTRGYQWELGYLREDFASEEPYGLIKNIFEYFDSNHHEAISLQAYRPAVYFGMASAWWDLFPVRTVGTAKETLHQLHEALNAARQVEKDGVCVYSHTRIIGEIMPVDEFVVDVEKAIQLVKELAGSDLYKRDDNEIIELSKDGKMGLLMTLNV